MAVAFVQALGTNQSKTAGTSLAIAVASLSVTAGNVIYVAFASDDVGSAHSTTDNLGNTYAIVTNTTNAGNVRAYLFKSTLTTGGTLTSITTSWTTNITAKSMVAGEYSGLGTQRFTDNTQGSSATASIFNLNWQIGDLVVAAYGWEGPNSDVLTIGGSAFLNPKVEVGQDGTTGGGVASNITCQLGHGIATSNWALGNTLQGNNVTSARDWACAGEVIIPAAVAGAAPYPYIPAGYYPTEG